MSKQAGTVRTVKDLILSSCALRREQPRPIDQFIDYFGSPYRATLFPTTSSRKTSTRR